MRDPRIHRALWGRRRGQACRIGIAARTARAVAKTLRVLERRPGANRDDHEREFNPEASRRARTVRSRRAASVPRRRSMARAGVLVSTVTRDGAGFQPSPARSSQASAPTARHSAASRPKTCATPAAPAAKSRMRRATDRLRGFILVITVPSGGVVSHGAKARTFEVVRRSVPPDCGAELFVGDQHRRLSVALSWRETLRGYRHPSASWPLAQRGEVHAVVGADEAEVSSRRRRSPRSDALEKGDRTYRAIKIGRPKRTRALGKASRVLRASHFLKILVSRQHWAVRLSPSPAHPLGYARP